MQKTKQNGIKVSNLLSYKRIPIFFITYNVLNRCCTDFKLAADLVEMVVEFNSVVAHI